MRGSRYFVLDWKVRCAVTFSSYFYSSFSIALSCTSDICDSASGCIHTNNEEPCDDGDSCTHTDTCLGGTCSGTGYSCDDFNECTDDVCLGDGNCSNTNNSNPCDDGNLCTSGDVCYDGDCSGVAISCDDGNP